MTFLWGFLVAAGLGIAAALIIATIVAFVGPRPKRWLPSVVFVFGVIFILAAVFFGFALATGAM